MMQVRWLILLITVVTCSSVAKSDITPVLLNKFNVPHAGFSTLLRTWTLNSTSWALVISSFNPVPFTTDDVYTIPNVEWQLTTNITPQVLTNQVTWPNGIVSAGQLVPYSIIIPSGFLVPGKTNGNLYFLDKGEPIALVPDESTKWFYHDADFKDMDRDGFLDIVSGRANVPVIGNPQTQLIWLKNPGNATIKGPWKLNILYPQGGPDVQVQFATVDSTQV